MDTKEQPTTHAKILVSSREGEKIELDFLDPPLKPTIFMTQRNAERRSNPPKKSLLKRIFGF